MTIVDQHDITSTAQITPDSAWFAGHFPGAPVLPGIAQLSIVFDAVRKAVNDDLCLRGFKKVKFKQIIKPNDILEISATPDKSDNSVYLFHITVGDKVACRGTMITKQPG